MNDNALPLIFIGNQIINPNRYKNISVGEKEIKLVDLENNHCRLALEMPVDSAISINLSNGMKTNVELSSPKS